jgi:hypothetical protein
VASLAAVIAVLARRCVLWDMKGQKGKREKGKARWQARTCCVLGMACGSPVFAVSPFAFRGR